MFLLGILLIIIGLAVALLLAHPQANALGGLLVIVGLILLVLAIVPAGDVDADRSFVLVGPALWRLTMRLLGRAALVVERRLSVR